MNAMQFIPTTEQLETLKEIAKILIDSKLYTVAQPKKNNQPQAPRDLTMPEALAKILRGLPLGLTPSESLEGINMVRGKLTMGSALMGTLMKKAGYDWVTEELTDTHCKLVFYRNGLELGVSEFSYADAVKGNIVTDMYAKFPRNMLMARAISNAAKWFAQDAFGGSVYTPDELQGDEKDDTKPTNPRRLPVEKPAPIDNPDLGMDSDGADYATELPDSAAAFDATPSAFPDTAPIGTSQHKALMATLSDMKITDDERHALIKLFTQERTTSSKDLTAAEFTRLMKLLKVWQAGLLAGEKKWNANHVLFAEKVSGETIHDFFLLNDAQIILVHAKVLKWLHAGNVTVPAKFNQL